MSFWSKIKIIFSDHTIRNRILFVVGALFIFRLFASIPVPGVDQFRLEQFFSSNQFFSLIDLFSGGGLSNLSIMMLGVAPYITSSIIMQLLTLMFPKLKALYHEEGESGRRKFTQISRLITVPLAVTQGIGYLMLLRNNGIFVDMSTLGLISAIIAVTAGSILLMWIGELISEFGVGNGVSILIFAGIVAGLPIALAQFFVGFTPDMIPMLVTFIIVAAIIIVGVVTVTEAERPIPITYAKQVRGNKVYGGVSTYLPLRLNQAGVIPIIFALAVIFFPQMFLNLLTTMAQGWAQGLAGFLSAFYNNTVLYSIVYFLLVFVFTYFYTAVTFEPNSIAENLQKSGAFIPGVRPGKSTSDYLGAVITRITFVGALFLGIIAVLPLLFRDIAGFASIAIGGTGLLIVVSVVIDLIKKLDAQVSMREY